MADRKGIPPAGSDGSLKKMGFAEVASRRLRPTLMWASFGHCEPSRRLRPKSHSRAWGLSAAYKVGVRAVNRHRASIAREDAMGWSRTRNDANQKPPLTRHFSHFPRWGDTPDSGS